MNQVTRIPQAGGGAVTGSGLSDRQVALLKRTIASDCNAGEFDLFVEVARMKGLDPFSRQIMPLVFSKDKPDKRRMSIVYGIEGLRALAARGGDYRPDEEEARIEYSDEAKDPKTNPLGIVKAVVRVHKQDSRGEWYPITGSAYWEEFAPLRKAWVYDEKRGKNLPTGPEELDTSGQWGKMPRIMLSKCAEAQALRRGWPEQVGGLYEPTELDQARAREIDLSASEIVERANREKRLEAVGGRSISFIFEPQGDLEAVPVGKIHDRLSEHVSGAPGSKALEWFASANKGSLNQYWSEDAGACLDIRTKIEEAVAEHKRREEAEAVES